ncbi:hypothetical protein GE061_003843, partial [Apolygus lucorum]
MLRSLGLLSTWMVVRRKFRKTKGCGGAFTGLRNSCNKCEQPKPECGACAKFKYMDLHCKLAVITGGATGIGFANSATLLCSQIYRVILADCHCDDGRKAAENLNKEHGKHKACFIQMDVRKHQDFEETLEEITRKFGGIDILVNNAGFLDDNYWKDEIDINVKAVIRGSLLGMKYLSQKRTPGNSVIVNVASTLGIDADPPYLPIFSATQHAIAGLTRSLGDNVHFKASGVRVIGICPGPTETNLMTCQQDKALVPDWSIAANMQFMENFQKWHNFDRKMNLATEK